MTLRMYIHYAYAVTIFIAITVKGDVWIRGSNNTTPAYFKAGEKMELVCESTQAASWSRQGILLENTPGFTVTRAIVELRTLTTLIKDVASISDRGPYKCEDGADSFIRDVAIFTMTAVNDQIEEVAVTSTHGTHASAPDATLRCEISINSIPTITWYRDGVALDSNNDKYDASTLNNSLTIKHADKKDIGEYVCSITLDHHTFNQTVMLEGGPGVKPFKQSKNLVQGERLHLDCEAWGYPLPSVRWEHEAQEVDLTDERISVEAYGEIEGGSLIIQDVDYDDGGEYTCIASINMSSANSTVLVRVKDKLAALWPFLGIVVEVTILCIIIFIYEKRRAKKMAENEEPEEAHLTNSNDHKEGKAVRQRK